MITRGLPATSILVVTERNYGYQFKSNYVKHHGLFVTLFLEFRYLHEISNVLQQKMNLIGQVFLKFVTPKDVLI